MTTFLTRFGAFVSFVLAGFDRLRFRGESRPLNNARGLDSYLYQEKIRYVDFRDHCQALTARLREQSERLAKSTGCRSNISTAPTPTKRGPPASWPQPSRAPIPWVK